MKPHLPSVQLYSTLHAPRPHTPFSVKELMHERSPDPIVQADQNGMIVADNQAARDILHAGQSLVGEFLKSLVPALDSGMITVQDGRQLQVTVVRDESYNAPFDTVFFRTPAIAAGTTVGPAPTEAHLRRAADEEGSAARAQFLANMSHEFRTPLNAVIGMAQLLTATTLTPHQRELATTMRRSSEALLALVNDILDFTKVDSGHIDFVVTPVDVTDLIESSLDMVAGAASAKSLRLFYDFQSGVPRLIPSDPTRLRQVLVNLLSNAVKFTETGSVTVGVRPTMDRGRQVLEIRVRDTGIGLKPGQAAKLFRPFSQGDASTTRKYGGTGLGLAICKSLIENMDGDIGITDGVTNGCETWFTVPFADCEVKRPRAVQPLAAVYNKRVVIVDEFEDSRACAARFFAWWGADVKSFATMEEARPHLATAWAVVLLSASDVTLQPKELSAQHWVASSYASDRDKWRGLQAQLQGSDRNIHMVSYPVQWSAMRQLFSLVGSGTVDASRSFIAVPAEVEGVGTEFFLPETQPTLSVLVAEDDPVNQRVAELMLVSTGCEVTIVENGQQALDVLQTRKFDIVFLDVQMPVLDGREAAREIVARHGQQRPWICAFTANVSSEERNECLRAGMDGFLTKPVSRLALQDVVNKVRHSREVANAPASSGDGQAPTMAELTGATGTNNKPARRMAGPSVGPMAAGLQGEMLTQRRRHKISRREISISKRLGDIESDSSRELVQDVVAMYLTEAVKSLDQLGAAVAAQDYPLVKRIAHRVKGATINIGAADLSALANRMEDAALTGEQASVEGLFAKLQHEQEAVALVLQAVISPQKED